MEDEVLEQEDPSEDYPSEEVVETTDVAPFEYDEESPNLAVDFDGHPEGVEAMRKIAMRVKEDFDEAWEGSAEYRDRVRDDHLLFAGDLPPKEYPYKGAANPHIPLMLENLTRLWFRMGSEIFGDWTSFFGVVPIGPDDETTADILSKHGNWQLRNEITDFTRQMHRAGLLFLGAGDVTCHSYRDPIRQRNCHDVLTVDEFVVPHTLVSTEPDYSDLPFYCKVLRYQRHELQAMRDIWFDVDKVLARTPTTGSEPDSPLGTAVAESQGITEPSNGKRAPYKLIHFEGWISELPGELDDRFVKVILDYETMHVLHMSIHEEDDWQEKLRFERQLAELEQYRAAKDTYDGAMKARSDAEADHQAVFNSEYADDYERSVAGVAIAEMRAQQGELPPPVPPEWLNDPEDVEEMPRPARKVPIRMFSHGVCIEPLTGVHGLGYGRILGDLNRVANVTTSQFLDAAHLANSKTIVTPSGFVFEGKFEVQPGKHNKVKGATGQEIRENMVAFEFGPANPQLLDVAKWVSELAQSAVQSPDVMSGEAGKSGETARGIASRIEQATKQLTVVARKACDFFGRILKCNAKLNSLYLPEEEIVNITDPATQQASPVQVRREMYERDYSVEFRSDLRFTSQAQRIAEADEILQMPTVNPALQTNMAFMYAATKKSLEARGRQDLIPTLGPPPPMPTEPMSLPPPMPPGA